MISTNLAPRPERPFDGDPSLESDARASALVPRRVAMIVVGFPSADHPNNGIFNYRAARALSAAVPVSVIHLRTWKPGRRADETTSVEAVSVTRVTAPQIPGAPLLNIPLYERLGWPHVRSIVESADLIHSVDAAFSGILASRWARRAGKHHVAQVIGSDVNGVLPRIRNSRAVAGWDEHLHGVACNSQALADGFLSLYPSVKNVRTVRRGVDLTQNGPSGPVAGPLSGRPPVRYLFLGGFPAYTRMLHGSNTKGGETLLAAWRQAEDALIESGASLLLAGPQSNGDGVQRWRASLRDQQRVWLAGTLDPAVVPSYLRSCDAVLVPSLQEGLPNVAMEASACGRPVFASDVGGNREVVSNGETGILLPAGDVRAWAQALSSHATKSDQLSLMGERARRRMESLFDSRLYAVKMLDLYRAALAVPLGSRLSGAHK